MGKRATEALQELNEAVANEGKGHTNVAKAVSNMRKYCTP